ncbi:anthranilate synthase component I family protein [Microbacterium schleiferi]|uniref:anthranilate synthase component I family protein n=1 Tax=Microbacterium schleiferi TaxID=69362 RepID=UPI0027E19B1C|nr:anthranilate synthase component I family protein [Microbacterium schleiferi]
MTTPPSNVPLAAWRDPEQVFCGWAHRYENAFWLDAGPGATTGKSWVGIGEPVASDAVERVVLRGSAAEDDSRSGERGPRPGAWVGWFDYDAGARRAGAPSFPDSGGDARWMQVRAVVEFDHAASIATVFAAGDAGELAAGLLDLPRPGEIPQPTPVVASARHDATTYAALIEECREQIRQGNAYQLCLTTRFEVQGAVDALAAYRRLRRGVSAHHGGFVRIADRALLSASPEQFLEADHGRIRTHPIKGTRPRSVDAEVDAELAEDLRADVKERAENVMIVDLMRNDLSRICQTGTVTVERLFDVESYPAVHQLVSTVAGDLRPNIQVGDLLGATFPAGSMTGAPKLSAMSILHRLEGAPRGLFAGCFGWISPQGDLDLAMVIRSIVIEQDHAYVGAGGGITWLSQASSEVAEVVVKARGPLAALGASVPPSWVTAAPGA